MDAFDALEAQLEDLDSDILKKIEELRKAVQWLNYSVKTKDGAKAVQFKGISTQLVKDIRETIAARGEQSDQVKRNLQTAFGELRLALDAYQRFNAGGTPPGSPNQTLQSPQGTSSVGRKSGSAIQKNATFSPSMQFQRKAQEDDRSREASAGEGAAPRLELNSRSIHNLKVAEKGRETGSTQALLSPRVVISQDAMSDRGASSQIVRPAHNPLITESMVTIRGGSATKGRPRAGSQGERPPSGLVPRGDRMSKGQMGAKRPDSIERVRSVVSDFKGVDEVRALYRHVAPIEEWLSFEAGDTIVLQSDPSLRGMPGWLSGVCERTGKVGKFPAAYTKPAEQEEVATSLPVGLVGGATVDDRRGSIMAVEVKAPSALTTDAEFEETLKEETRHQRQARRQRRGGAAVYKDEAAVDEDELQKRETMGIAHTDRRASVMISRELVKQMMDGMGSSTDGSAPVPKALLYEDGTKPVAPSVRKPSSGSEKKKLKGELEAILGRIVADDKNCRKVDYSETKLSYPYMKRLFAAVATSKHLVVLKLANVGLTSKHLQLFEVSIRRNRSLREMDMANNGWGIKEARLLETIIQKNYGLVKLRLFQPEEVAGKKELMSTMQNIEWYLSSNVAFIEFNNKRSNELRICGRAITSMDGLEHHAHAVLLNASFNYVKEIPPRISNLAKLRDLNVSHNDIKAIPYSVAQLVHLTSLDVSHNNLKDIPSSLDRLTALKVLTVESNKLRYLPRTVISMENLTDVYAKGNRFKHFPKNYEPGQKSVLLENYCS